MVKLLNITLEDKFKANLGLVISGGVDAQYYGEIESGNYLEFTIGGEKIIRKIKDVDYFRPPHYLNIEEVKTRFTGLLIECENEEELDRIMSLESIRQTGTIWKH